MTNADDLAFPHTDSDASTFRSGLTKREYFAAAVLQGMMANGEFYKIASQRVQADDIPHFYSICAVEHADAIIGELNKKY